MLVQLVLKNVLSPFLRCYDLSMGQLLKKFAVFMIIVFGVVWIGQNQPTYASEGYDSKRKHALQKLKNGDQAGLKDLLILSGRGDARASYLLGLFYLAGKFVPEKDDDLAHEFLIRSANDCNRDSVQLLRSLYLKRGSYFFDPLKAQRLSLRCSSLSEQETDLSDQLEEDIENFFDSDRRIVTEDEGTQPREKQNQQSVEKIDNIPILMTKSSISAWQNIMPIYEDFDSSGSAVAVSSDGFFVTNFHVINGCKNIAIKYNGLIGKADVVNYNTDLDVALIAVRAPTPFFAAFDRSALRFGEWLFALGYPINEIFGDGPSYSEGRLTNTQDTETIAKKEGFLLVSIPIASGNSGGPVFNRIGGLRGISSYGVKPEELAEYFKKKTDMDIYIESTTLNFAVSGLKIADWLEELGVRVEATSKSNSNRDIEKLANEKVMTLGKVECYGIE